MSFLLHGRFYRLSPLCVTWLFSSSILSLSPSLCVTWSLSTSSITTLSSSSSLFLAPEVCVVATKEEEAEEEEEEEEDGLALGHLPFVRPSWLRLDDIMEMRGTKENVNQQIRA